MCSLLLFAVLLTVLLQPVAASYPIMDLTPPVSQLELPYPMDELFACACGGMQFDFCLCLGAMPQITYDDAAALVHPHDFVDMPLHDSIDMSLHDSIDMPLHDTFETDVDLAPVLDYVTEDHRPALNNEYIQSMDANETTVQPITIQAHIKDTYTPGDRSSSHPPKSRKRSHKRQAPRERGFICNELGCNEVFNRQCDLNRHRKTSHLNERPHVCPTCDKGFLYPKDLRRHTRQHNDPSSVMVTFRCEHPDCSNLDGFSRKDNLQRHRRRQHPPQ